MAKKRVRVRFDSVAQYISPDTPTIPAVYEALLNAWMTEQVVPALTEDLKRLAGDINLDITLGWDPPTE